MSGQRQLGSRRTSGRVCPSERRWLGRGGRPAVIRLSSQPDGPEQVKIRYPRMAGIGPNIRSVHKHTEALIAFDKWHSTWGGAVGARARPVGHAVAALGRDRANPPMLCDRPCSRTARMRRRGRPTGIGRRNEQQHSAHGQEELARRPEHEAAQPDQR